MLAKDLKVQKLAYAWNHGLATVDSGLPPTKNKTQQPNPQQPNPQPKEWISEGLSSVLLQARLCAASLAPSCWTAQLRCTKLAWETMKSKTALGVALQQTSKQNQAKTVKTAHSFQLEEIKD